jgi:effector-binding domain-containing protein
MLEAAAGTQGRWVMAHHEVHEVEVAPRSTAVIRATLDVPEIGPWFGHALGTLAASLAERGIVIVGQPFARYHPVTEGEDRFEVEAGFPVGGPIEPHGDVEASTLPGGPHATTVHVGPYDGLPAAYDALAKWIAAEGGMPAGDIWEVYESDPEQEPDPATWRTRVFWPYEPPPSST